MSKRTRKLTVAMVLAGSLIGAVPARGAYAEEGGQSELHRRRPALPDAPPDSARGLSEREDHGVPDRPPQATTPDTGGPRH